MKNSTNIVALLGVAGGLGAATLPSAARANCSPSGDYSRASGPANPYAGGNAPSIDLDAEYARGQKAFEAGDFRRARAVMAVILPYAGKQALVYYIAGASRIELGDHKGAVKLLQKAVSYDGDLLVAQRDLGVACARTGDTAKAQAMLATLEAKAAQGGAGTAPMLAAIEAIKAAMVG